MSSPRTQITVNELNDEIVPRLDLVEKLINTTLASLIETTESVEERERREDQKRRFELMLLSIRMNVASVSRRHATVIRAAQNGDRTGGSLCSWMKTRRLPWITQDYSTIRSRRMHVNHVTARIIGGIKAQWTFVL